jgi:signal peptide peptidase SppA
VAYFRTFEGKNERHKGIVRMENRMSHTHIISAFTRSPWAIVPDRFAVLQEIISRHIAGEKLDAEETQTVLHGARRPADRKSGKIAILPLFGTIFPRANLMTDVSGATSAEIFGNKFDDLVNDPEVSAVILDVDSPGGQVTGIEELSRKIYDARGKKPIVAIANHAMDSAAYWIGSAAEEVVITPSGEVGSIGVFAAHWDQSAALEKEGLKLSLISEGKYKTEGNPYQPLSEEARAFIQGLVKEAYETFVKDVARNRNKTSDEVRNGFGQGRIVEARKAVNSGMVDRIATLEETIDRLLNLNLGKQGLNQGKIPGREITALSLQQQRESDELQRRVTGILAKGKQDPRRY